MLIVIRGFGSDPQQTFRHGTVALFILITMLWFDRKIVVKELGTTALL